MYFKHAMNYKLLRYIFTLMILREYLKYGIYFANYIIERNFAYRCCYGTEVAAEVISGATLQSRLFDKRFPGNTGITFPGQSQKVMMYSE
jgi:hypothetical protein